MRAAPAITEDVPPGPVQAREVQRSELAEVTEERPVQGKEEAVQLPGDSAPVSEKKENEEPAESEVVTVESEMPDPGSEKKENQGPSESEVVPMEAEMPARGSDNKEEEKPAEYEAVPEEGEKTEKGLTFKSDVPPPASFLGNKEEADSTINPATPPPAEIKADAPEVTGSAADLDLIDDGVLLSVSDYPHPSMPEEMNERETAQNTNHQQASISVDVQHRSPRSSTRSIEDLHNTITEKLLKQDQMEQRKKASDELADERLQKRRLEAQSIENRKLLGKEVLLHLSAAESINIQQGSKDESTLSEKND